jgi:hypothetical protein
MTAISVLEREQATFSSHKADLVENHLGRFALISGDKVESIWDTYVDALQAGYDHFGLDKAFMVREIKAKDTVHLVYRGGEKL